MTTFDLTHARHDPAHCLAPGLFRSLRRGERKKQKLDVSYRYGDVELRFVGFEPLDGQDMRLLQGVIALAGPCGNILSSEPCSETGRKLRTLLAPTADAASADAIVIKSTLSKLMREVGYKTDGAESRSDMKASLLRMSNVTISAKKGTRTESFHLMSHGFDEATGELHVALNPRVAEAVVGSAKGFTHIDMNEVRSLQSDPARLAHQRLCGWIAPGKAGKAEIDTICDYVWPDPAKPEAIKKRRQAARRALDEIRGLGWSVEEYSNGKFVICRPGRPNVPLAPS